MAPAAVAPAAPPNPGYHPDPAPYPKPVARGVAKIPGSEATTRGEAATVEVVTAGS